MARKTNNDDILAALSALSLNLSGLVSRVEAVEKRPAAPQRPAAPPLPVRQGTGNWPVTPGVPPMNVGTVRVTPQGNVPLRQVAPARPAAPAQGAPRVVVRAAPQAPIAPIPGPRQQTSYSREEQGSNRYHKCVACNQNERMGVVVVATGEYLASGFGTEYLRLLPAVEVNQVQGDGSVMAMTVSGQWLAKELNSRPKRTDGRQDRAVSIPGWMACEPNSSHPTLSLSSPIVRRATREEESIQVIGRIGAWLAGLDPAQVIQAAQGSGPAGLARLVGAAQDLLTFADKVTGPLTH